LQNIKFQAPNYKQISNFHPLESSGGGPPKGGIPQGRYSMTKTKNRFGISNFGHCDLPFDLAQGGESFDIAQDRESVERLVEPFDI
jgi:hypothetical protein